VIEGFPKVDSEEQNLVQMENSLGTILVGVRDHEGGENQSGWIFLNSGVKEESHGNHAHWYYKKKPSVIASRLDAQQGESGHIYTAMLACFIWRMIVIPDTQGSIRNAILTTESGN